MFLSAGKIMATAKTNVMPEPDVPFSLVSLLLHMDGVDGGTVFTDQKNHVVTRVGTDGGPRTSTVQSKFGSGSGLFNSAQSQYLSIPNGPEFAFGTGNFIVEGWFRLNSVGTQVNLVGNMHNNDGNLTWAVRVNADRTVSFYGWTEVYVSSTEALTANQWYHIAISRVGATVYAFINGVLSGSASAAAMNFTGTGGAGLYVGFNEQYFNGYIDDLRIVKGQGISAAFSPPSAPYPDIGAQRLAISGAGANNSTNIFDIYGHPVTLTGDTKISTAVIAAGAIAFDGTGDYAQVAGTPDTAIGTQSFCIEFYATNTSTNQFGGFFQLSSTPGGFTSAISGNSISLEMSLGVVRLDAGGNAASTSFAPTVNVENHYAISRDAAVNQTSLYVNGVKQFHLGDLKDYLGGHLALGGYENLATNLLPQLMRSFIITVGTPKYTANFTPPPPMA